MDTLLVGALRPVRRVGTVGDTAEPVGDVSAALHYTRRGTVLEVMGTTTLPWTSQAADADGPACTTLTGHCWPGGR